MWKGDIYDPIHFQFHSNPIAISLFFNKMKENIDIFVLCVLLKFYMSKCICFSATNKGPSPVKATPPEDQYLKLCLLGNRKALLSQIQKNNEGQNPISRSTVKRRLLAVVSGEKKKEGPNTWSWTRHYFTVGG